MNDTPLNLTINKVLPLGRESTLYPIMHSFISWPAFLHLDFLRNYHIRARTEKSHLSRHNSNNHLTGTGEHVHVRHNRYNNSRLLT